MSVTTTSAIAAAANGAAVARDRCHSDNNTTRPESRYFNGVFLSRLDPNIMVLSGDSGVSTRVISVPKQVVWPVLSSITIRALIKKNTQK